jgi:glycosyltransferase involved in cell wall biosynthesis
MYEGNKICVIIPAFNEEHQISMVIDNLPNYVDNIVVVNDGSTDGTADIAKCKGTIVISHEKNKGVGAAFRTGLKKATELNVDIMVNIDGDGQFDPKDVGKLIAPIIEKKADFVIGSRFKNKDFHPKMSKIKFYGNKFMSFLISRIVGMKYYDVSCGFRAYSKEAYLRLNLFGEFTYTHETILDLAFKNVTIAEIPIKVEGTRKHGKSRVASNLIRYGYQTLKIILKSFRDYKPLVFFGLISFLSFLIGLKVGLFFIIYYVVAGKFTPHKWAGFTAGFFISMSLLFIFIGFILDMFARMRRNQEEIIYYLKNKL